MSEYDEWIEYDEAMRYDPGAVREAREMAHNAVEAAHAKEAAFLYNLLGSLVYSGAKYWHIAMVRSRLRMVAPYHPVFDEVE